MKPTFLLSITTIVALLLLQPAVATTETPPPAVSSFYLFDPEQLFFSGLDYIMDGIYDEIVPFIIREKGDIIFSFWNIEGSVGCSSCKMASWLI